MGIVRGHLVQLLTQARTINFPVLSPIQPHNGNQAKQVENFRVTQFAAMWVQNSLPVPNATVHTVKEL